MWNSTSTLCRWLWSMLLRQEVVALRLRLNAQKTRSDKKKIMPSGVSPDVAYALPERFGLKDHLLPIDTAVIKEIKESLGGDAILEFVEPEFAQTAQTALDSLNISKLTPENVWAIFVALLPLVFPPM